ncbi:unnamed protein product, partial [Tuber aestivum]
TRPGQAAPENREGYISCWRSDTHRFFFPHHASLESLFPGTRTSRMSRLTEKSSSPTAGTPKGTTLGAATDRRIVCYTANEISPDSDRLTDRPSLPGLSWVLQYTRVLANHNPIPVPASYRTSTRVAYGTRVRYRYLYLYRSIPRVLVQYTKKEKEKRNAKLKQNSHSFMPSYRLPLQYCRKSLSLFL